MHLPGSLEIPLRLLLLLAGLLAPGSMILRALRLPWSLAAAFISSSVVLYLTILIFACTGATISLPNLAMALGVITLAARAFPTVRPHSQTDAASLFPAFSCMGGWLVLYLIFWAIVGYRLVFQPLTGPDVYFRWSYLAEQMLHFGSLDFYPPRRGEDFVRYFWAESIPPGIASLYAWAYACGGSKQALWTSPVVALQLLSMHEVIWRMGHRWGGLAVARRAVLFAAACPLLTWSFLIGQETGLTALSVSGLALCLFELRERNGAWNGAVLAGIFATAAAGTREYGPIFAVTAIVAAWWLRVSRRGIAWFAAIALPLALAWPVRVWLLTGNPFYSLEVGALFPTNAVFVAWTHMFHAPQADAFASFETWVALVRYGLLWALPATAGLVALIFLLRQRGREAQVIALMVAVVTALWFVSVRHTAGGLFYSLRVMAPAFALLVVVASCAWESFGKSGIARLATVGLALIFLESLPKTLVLPENPYRLEPRAWLQGGNSFSTSVRAGEQEFIAQLQGLPGRARFLTDNAGLQRVLTPMGMEAVPLWSPEVSWLFDPALHPAEVARRWRKSGLRYVIIGKGSAAFDFVQRRAQWPTPYFTVTTALETENALILMIEADFSTETPLSP